MSEQSSLDRMIEDIGAFQSRLEDLKAESRAGPAGDVDLMDQRIDQILDITSNIAGLIGNLLLIIDQRLGADA